MLFRYTWNNVSSNVPLYLIPGLQTFILGKEWMLMAVLMAHMLMVLCLFPIAFFTASPQNGSAPLNVFNEYLTEQLISWDFGNGQMKY